VDSVDVNPYDKNFRDRQLAKRKVKLERPPTALFDNIRISQLYGGHLIKRTHDGGYKFKGKIFTECGLLSMTVSCLSVKRADPTPLDAQLFIIAYEKSDIPLHGLRIEKFWRHHDCVKFIRGDYVSIQGNLVGDADAKVATVIVPDLQTNSSTRVTALVDDLERVILAGDHVRVKVGRHAGVQGIVSVVDGSNISLIQDTDDIVSSLNIDELCGPC
jgi:hypothetical protein